MLLDSGHRAIRCRQARRGAAITKALAAEGASVVVNYASSKAGADTVVAAITEAGGKAVAVGGDVSKAAEAQGIIDAAIKNYGRLDILVNNSGVYEFAPIEAIRQEQFHKGFNINVLDAILTTRAAVKHLGEDASIINVGSNASRITPANSTVYSHRSPLIEWAGPRAPPPLGTAPLFSNIHGLPVYLGLHSCVHFARAGL